VALLLGGTLAAWRLTAPAAERNTPSPEQIRTRTLVRAVEEGDIGRVRAFLDEGADPNTERPVWIPARLTERGKQFAAERRRYNGTPLLQIATRNRNVGLVRLLLTRGARPDARGRYGYTALMYAATVADPLLCRILLDRGTDPNAQEDVLAQTPLMMAAASRDRRRRADARPGETVRLLLARGARPGERDRRGQTALELARRARNADAEAVLKATPAAVR
jgi:ankyrin repeat protein